MSWQKLLKWNETHTGNPCVVPDRGVSDRRSVWPEFAAFELPGA